MTQQARAPKVAIVAAMTRDRVIGLGDRLPWDLPEDLHLFKRLTIGATVVMGRKTYQSIGHPLPGRQNIILSRSLTGLPGVMVCNNFTAGLEAASRFGRAVFILGGVELYRKALPFASVLHISWVKKSFHGDVYFPEFDLADWAEVAEQDYADFHYVKYLRRSTDKAHRL